MTPRKRVEIDGTRFSVVETASWCFAVRAEGEETDVGSFELVRTAKGLEAYRTAGADHRLDQIANGFAADADAGLLELSGATAIEEFRILRTDSTGVETQVSWVSQSLHHTNIRLEKLRLEDPGSSFRAIGLTSAGLPVELNRVAPNDVVPP
jgi:hypothetical protein